MLRATPPSWRRSRLRRPAAVVAAAALGALLAAAGCGTDAVGVEACRQVETVRCEVAPRCVGFRNAAPVETEQQVQNCKEFYRDHCLLGLENTKADPGQGEIDECVKAIRATAKCDSPQQSTMATCGVALREGLDTETAPCEVLQKPHWLEACKWLDKNRNIGSGGDGDGSGGAGGAGSATTDASSTSTDATTGASTGETTSASSTSATTGGLDEEI